MGRAVVLLLAAASCRFHFDPLEGAGDGATIDSGPIGSGGLTGTNDAYIKASNTGADDHFGEAMALSPDGSTLAVGAPGEDSAATGIDGLQSDNTIAYAGAVYVFTRPAGVWSQQAYVKPDATTMEAIFGASLAMSADGSTLAVGAPSKSATGLGRVYVFTRSGATWSQEAFIDASNPDPGDTFGEDVALSADGNTLAVGASGESSNATGINGNEADNSSTSTGAAYVFTRAGTTWTKQAYVKGTPNSGGDGFARHLALSDDGNTLVATARGDDGVQIDSGIAYVFVRAGTTWSQQARIKASNPGDTDRADAITLSGSGDWLAFGSTGEDSAATGVDGNQSDNSAGDAGAVYVFSRMGTAWSQRAYLKATNTGAGDRFGQSLAMNEDGSLLAIGAPAEDSGSSDSTSESAADAGAVYVFAFANGVWAGGLYVKAPNVGGTDGFGTDVALSAAGDALSVTAWYEDSNAIGVGGDATNNSRVDAGAAYMFK